MSQFHLLLDAGIITSKQKFKLTVHSVLCGKLCALFMYFGQDIATIEGYKYDSVLGVKQKYIFHFYI